MAVETRFVVVRGGNEIMTFADKKAADEYDRMLDMADNLSSLFNQFSPNMDEQLKEELGIYLAKNRDEVLFALLAKKRPTPNKGQRQSSANPTEPLANHESQPASHQQTSVTNSEVTLKSISPKKIVKSAAKPKAIGT